MIYNVPRENVTITVDGNILLVTVYLGERRRLATARNVIGILRLRYERCLLCEGEKPTEREKSVGF